VNFVNNLSVLKRAVLVMRILVSLQFNQQGLIFKTSGITILQNVLHLLEIFRFIVQLTLKSYAGGSVATGRVSQAGQVKSEDPDGERHPGPPGWGLGIGLTSQSRKNKFVEKKKMYWKQNSTTDCSAREEEEEYCATNNENKVRDITVYLF
jgi:hypothetical protein